MRVVKNLIVKNDKTGLVSDIFDKCLRELGYQFFDKIELHIKTEDKLKIEFPNAYIYLNYNNPFIQGSDKKAIKILILKQLVSLAILYKYHGKKIPHFILEIMSNREVMRKGYEKDIFYYYYLSLLQYEPHNVKEFKTFLKINIPWLSFFGIDNYDSKSMKKHINSFKYDKDFELIAKSLFLAVKKDLLKEKTFDSAIEAYHTMNDR